MAQRTNLGPLSWTGWAYFASALLLAVGGMQIVAGLAGIFNADFYGTAESSLVAFGYTAWGWINLVLGVVAVLAAVGALLGMAWSRVIGTVTAVLVMVAAVAFMTAFPLWSLVTVVAAGFTLFALTMHAADMNA
ncbi:MAG: hypothetical protein JWN82_424 [Candidatus Saccharibacteria bacterium]|nr:hypothetical protein [Candidatus Saccharibacteria bacterium]